VLRLLVVLSVFIALLVAILGSESPFLAHPSTTAAPTVVRVQAAATLAPRVVAVKPTPFRETVVLAEDDFSSPSQDAWSSAPKGGDYALEGPANDFAEQSGVGTIRTPSGEERGATLSDVYARDIDLRVRVQSDRAAEGGNQFIFITLRELGGATNYRARVRFDTAGSVWLQFARTTGGATELLGTDTRLADLAYTPAASLWVRAVAVGGQTTTLGLKAWPDGQSEPDSWQYVATDADQRLSKSGAAGLNTYVSAQATNAPVTFGFSDLRITSASEDQVEVAQSFVALPTPAPAAALVPVPTTVEVPVPVSAPTPIPTPVPTPEPRTGAEVLQALEPELGAAWGHDTDRTLTLLQAFLAQFPNDQAGQEKLYAALLAKAQDLQSTGDTDQARADLEQARQLLPTRGEAGAQLARIAPTPGPAETDDPQPAARVVAVPPPAPGPAARVAPAPAPRVSASVRAPAPPAPASVVQRSAPTPTKVPFVAPAARP
jgi:hypothetical protein